MALAENACSRGKNNQWRNFRTLKPSQKSHVGKNQRKTRHYLKCRFGHLEIINIIIFATMLNDSTSTDDISICHT